MTGRIYQLDDSTLNPLLETRYEAEALLQRLLADHPDLLAGDQMNQADPRRWLLVSREVSVPDSDVSRGRWSLDHLFLDQEGIPTLVEVKRSSDTRARREVVAQMLDYAANATAYWSVDRIRLEVKERCQRESLDPDVQIRDLVGGASSDEEYWQRVKTNLLAGRVRMVFVADRIPKELLRIVEFLNEQMDPAEVLAVEVRQFVGAGTTTLVPRVLGQTAEAVARKSIAAGRSWDLDSMLEDLRRRHGQSAVEVAIALHDWAQALGAEFRWGRGSTYGSFSLRFDVDGETFPLFVVSSEGYLEVGLPKLAAHGPFAQTDLLLELIARLNDVPGVAIDQDLSRWPRIQLDEIADAGAARDLLNVWDWYVEKARGSERPAD